MSELKPNLETTLMGLQYLAGFDKSDIESDDFECLGEDENGNSGCCTVSITELAADAYKLLNDQRDTSAIEAAVLRRVAKKLRADHPAEAYAYSAFAWAATLDDEAGRIEKGDG